MKAIEVAGIRHQARPFRLEDLPDGLFLELGMIMGLGMGKALVQQPGVQLIKALGPKPGCEEAATDCANLLLDLDLEQPDAGVQATGSTRKWLHICWKRRL